MMFTAATAALLRLIRRDARVERHCVEEATHVRSDDFDSVMDEKAGLRLAMKEYIDSNDERWD
jgi:hypothetical protein